MTCDENNSITVIVMTASLYAVICSTMGFGKCKHQILKVVVVFTARCEHALHTPSSSFVSYKLIMYVETAIAMITLQEAADIDKQFK